MHPYFMYDLAHAKIDDELRAAEQRRLARLAKESRTPRDPGVGIVARVWTRFTGVNPAKPALSGSAK